jgi:hypothetical protein
MRSSPGAPVREEHSRLRDDAAVRVDDHATDRGGGGLRERSPVTRDEEDENEGNGKRNTKDMR